MDRLTISDLFFNSKEGESINGLCDNAVAHATEFLANYPAIKQYITAEELAKDYLKRV